VPGKVVNPHQKVEVGVILFSLQSLPTAVVVVVHSIRRVMQMVLQVVLAEVLEP
jgi:hypothetical protein